MALVKFFRGTRANYTADLAKKPEDVKNGVYFITDEHCIIMNEVQYGGVDNQMFDGFIKDVDVEGTQLTFKKDVKGVWTDVTIELLKAADNSIVLGAINNDGVKDGATIKVNVKDVLNEDGLKLGDDGLYVDLTKTTTAISDEKTRALAAEKANKDAIDILNGKETVAGSVAKSVKDAVEALDVDEVGGTGKVITTISETDGKIAATAIDLKAENVAFTATSKVDGAVDVTGTTVTAAIASLAKSVKDTQVAAATYKVAKVTEGLAENVKEAYQLVQTVNGVDTNIDVQIPIYKDQTLKSVELVAENAEKKKGQFMKYTYIDANGKDVVVYVDCSKFLVESEFGDGLKVSEAGVVSALIDETGEFLSVSEKGIKVSGVQTAIDTAKAAVIGDEGDTTDKDTIKAVKKAVSDEATTARAAEKANKDAITKLNGDAKTEGSVAKAVADAKTELLGGAADNYNTLGKLEDRIQEVDSKATKAHTEVTAKATGHVTVTVKDSEDATHKVVTIAENDIASANDLSTETTNRKSEITRVEGLVTAEKERAVAAEAQTLTDAKAYTDKALEWIEGGSY